MNAAGVPPRPGVDRETRGWVYRTAALLAVLVAVIVGVGLLVAAVRTDLGRHDDAVAAQGVAAQVAVNLASGNQADLPERVERLKALATGDFRSQLDSTGEAWRVILEQGKVDSRGTVVSTGLERAGAGSVDVLVALDASVRSTVQEQPQLRHYRLAVNLRRVDHEWRAARVEAVP